MIGASRRSRRWNEQYQTFQLVLRIDEHLRRALEYAGQLTRLVMESRADEDDVEGPEDSTPGTGTRSTTLAEAPASRPPVVHPSALMKQFNIAGQTFRDHILRLYRTARSETARHQVRESIRLGAKNGLISDDEARELETELM